MPSVSRVAWAKFRVSAVSFVALLIFSVLAYLLSGGSLLERRAPVYLYLPDAEGLEADAPVRVDGIDVGLVKTVELTGSADHGRTVKVTMEIDRSILPQIPAASEAEISSDSLIGDKFVDVTSHPAKAGIQPGGELKVKESADLMKAIDIRDLERQLAQLEGLLDDLEAGRGPVGEFIMSRQMYDDVVLRSAQVEAALKAAVGTYSAMGSVLYRDDLYRQFLDTIVSLDNQLAELQSGQGETGHLLRDPAQYEEWLKNIRGIHESIAQLHASPLVQSDEPYQTWDRNIAGLIQQVDELSVHPMLNQTDIYERLGGMAQDLQNTVRDFRLHPKKYLRLKVF